MAIPTVKSMPNGGVRHYGGEPHRGVLSEGRWGYFYAGKNYRVSRLVCEAFSGPSPFEGALVLHEDENSENNCASNLRWGTQVENLAAPGFQAYAKRRGFAAPKINEDQARIIKYGGGSCRDAAKRFGISAATVSNIRAGRGWKHI